MTEFKFEEKKKLWQKNWFTKDIQIKDHFHDNVLISEMFGVRGFLTQGDILFLWDIGYNLPENGNYLEVGSWMGLSSLAVSFGLLSNMNFTSKVYCVDTWEVMFEQEGFQDELRNKDLYENFLENIERSNTKKFIVPIRGKSTEIADKVEDNFYDVIFIDGDHSFEGCYGDIISYLPKVKKGGKMYGHDAAPNTGVVEALDKIKEEKGLDYYIMKEPYTNYIWELYL